MAAAQATSRPDPDCPAGADVPPNPAAFEVGRKDLDRDEPPGDLYVINRTNLNTFLVSWLALSLASPSFIHPLRPKAREIQLLS
jgi:hypothetical protein